MINMINIIFGLQLNANEAMKSYVLGDSGLCQADNIVALNISHSNLKVIYKITPVFMTRCRNQAKFMEIRLDKHMTIQEVLEKLRRHTGTSKRRACQKNV